MDPSTATDPNEIAMRSAEQERFKLLVLGAGIRLVAATIFLALNLIFSAVNQTVSWWPHVPAMIAYSLVAGVVFALRRRRLIARVAPLAAMLDLLIPYLVLRVAIEHHPDVAQFVAGLALGIFAVIVSLCGLTLQRSYVILAAVVATAEEYLLLYQVGAPCLRMFLPPGVLALAAGTGLIVVDRTRRLLSEAAERESTHIKLASTKAQYDELTRLQEDKDSLVQLIVHDMKGPISAAILSLEYLNRELGRQQTSRDVREAVEDALSSSSNVAHMISQILDTTKLEEGCITLNLQSLPARELLETARRQALTRVQSKSIRVDVDAPDALTLSADRRLFPRLIDNLLANAIRNTPDEGRILLVAVHRGKEIVLSVHNTGTAIPAADRGKIFEKFQQGDSETRRVFGWGLGLYFCRLVTEAHHGNITVEDVEGWPTSFIVRLPANSEA